MSSEQSTEVASGARRRIVALPVRTEALVALIVREPEQRETLAERLGRRRVVQFPSLAHFCTEEQRRQPWAGIVVGYSCAWDAQLDGFVPHRSCIALYEVSEEGFGWPEAVARIGSFEQLEAWVTDQLSPNPAWKLALEEARKNKPRRKRAGTAAQPAARQLQLIPDNIAFEGGGVVIHDAGVNAQPAASAPKAAARRAGRPKRVPVERAPKRAPAERPARVAEPGRRPRKTADAVQAVAASSVPPRKRVQLSARELEQARSAALRRQGDLLRLAGEIGLSRANQLLLQLRANAEALRKRGR